MNPSLPAHTQIAAIVPCYNTSGDSTTVFSIDGSATILASRVRAVIQRLAKSRAIDLAALRKHIRSLTERTNLEPLPLAPGLVLVPVKVRLPRIAGDVTTGYINFHAIDNICASTKKPFQTTITLSGKTEIPVLWTTATVSRQLALARLAAKTAPTTQPRYAGILRESFPGYEPELLNLAVKLIDIFHDILSIKQHQ
ncbi:hypothetical protein [Sporomusa sp. KB1]|jgi:hypothetical protein|uniref:hypothetical protein n=1 Tax=Sporomusa sp. KB1 TaxID=943346 RepID=UPI00119DC4BA|nr:hypothetical protein [Sporomusa sp. KB1]TWH45256.1 hypothetical protein Salpa_1161 [Sporomusa sp. KB1]